MLWRDCLIDFGGSCVSMCALIIPFVSAVGAYSFSGSTALYVIGSACLAFTLSFLPSSGIVIGAVTF